MHIYCSKCKKHTGNTFPKEVALTLKNKIKRKSKCATCSTERTFFHKIEDKYDLKDELGIDLQFLLD